MELIVLNSLILYLALWNCLRLVQALRSWDLLAAYQARGGPLYLVISGGTWAILGFYLVWATWRQKPWAWGALLGSAAGYTAWVFFDRYFMQNQHNNNEFFLAGFIAGLIFFLLLHFSRSVREFHNVR